MMEDVVSRDLFPQTPLSRFQSLALLPLNPILSLFQSLLLPLNPMLSLFHALVLFSRSLESPAADVKSCRKAAAGTRFPPTMSRIVSPLSVYWSMGDGSSAAPKTPSNEQKTKRAKTCQILLPLIIVV